MEVEILNVPRVLRRDLLHAVLSVALVVEVDSAEFSLQFGANVFQGEIFVDSEETPMRDVDGL